MDVREEVEKIANQVKEKLPPEVTSNLVVSPTVYEKIYNYVNKALEDYLNQFIEAAEEALVSKTARLESQLESRIKNQPTDISYLLDNLANPLTREEIDSSLVKIYSGLQEFINKLIREKETLLATRLNEKEYIEAVMKGNKAHYIVKCSFKDDLERPSFVYNIKLSVNIPESELLIPIIPRYTLIDYPLKELIAQAIIERVNEAIKDSPITSEQALLDRLNKLEESLSQQRPEEIVKISRTLLRRLEGTTEQALYETYDPISVRDIAMKILNQENLWDMGFDYAVNVLVATLKKHGLSYKFIDNMKNARKLIIREYDTYSKTALPDERFEITLTYLDMEQLKSKREAFLQQATMLSQEISNLYTVVQVMKYSGKKTKGYTDYSELVKSLEKDVYTLQEKGVLPYVSSIDTKWDEIGFIEPTSEIPNFDKLYSHDKSVLKKVRQLLDEIFEHKNPPEKIVVIEKLNLLETKLEEFYKEVNPYDIMPGLLLEVDIVSIKRLKTTIMSMASVINEFLETIKVGRTS